MAIHGKGPPRSVTVVHRIVPIRRWHTIAAQHGIPADRCAREIDLSNKCSYKAGRAFDTVFDYRAGGNQVLYISPEWLAGRLFWRLYLRAARQDGSQGAPITAAVFDTANRTLLPPPRGYFVDFTALAAQYG